jgi:hypothetical protein
VDFTVDSLRTTVDQTGVDVIDTVGTQQASWARQLSPWAMSTATLRLVRRESRLLTTWKTHSLEGNRHNQREPSVLIYDAATAKVSKASTFRLNESATEYSTFSLSPSASKTVTITTTLPLVVLQPTTLPQTLWALSGSTIAVGLEELITTSTQASNSKLKSNLRIFDGTPRTL